MTTKQLQNAMNASNVTPSEGYYVNIIREGEQSKEELGVTRMTETS